MTNSQRRVLEAIGLEQGGARGAITASYIAEIESREGRGWGGVPSEQL